MLELAHALGSEMVVCRASPGRVIFPKGLMMVPLLYICSKQGNVQPAATNKEKIGDPLSVGGGGTLLGQDAHAT